MVYTVSIFREKGDGSVAYDVLVIGGGPAGLSAAVNVRARGRSVLVVSNPLEENPLWPAQRVDNYLGLPGLSGRELLTAMRRHAEDAGADFREGKVLSAVPMGDTWYVSVGRDMENAAAVILAAGVDRGRKFPGEAEFLGRGVSYCATCDGMLYRGKEVAVVGLAADAPQEANWLKEIGCKVTYISPNEPDALRPDIPAVKAGKVEVLGGQKVEGLRAGSTTIPCEGVFILRASMAPADLLPGLELDGNYIKVDRNMATSIPGVFAAGDCTGLPLQVSKAVGEGQVAGHRAAEYIDHNPIA